MAKAIEAQPRAAGKPPELNGLPIDSNDFADPI
jgi:hypothetical protein